MGLEALIEFGERDDAWGDMYSLFRHVFESSIEEELPTRPVYYFERVEGAFQRPSFKFTFVSRNPIPYNAYLTWWETAVQVSFFSEDVFECQHVQAKLQKLFAPHRDVILPKYDYTTNPPEKISVTGVNDDGQVGPSQMGIRIDRTTVTGRSFQEPDERWQAVIGFNMRSPDIACFDPVTLEQVKIEHLGPPVELPPLVVESGVSSTAEVEQTE